MSALPVLVYVCNMDAVTTEEELKNMCSHKAEAVTIVEMDGQPRYGMLHFKKLEEAQAAVKDLNGKILRGIALAAEVYGGVSFFQAMPNTEKDTEILRKRTSRKRSKSASETSQRSSRLTRCMSLHFFSNTASCCNIKSDNQGYDANKCFSFINRENHSFLKFSQNLNTFIKSVFCKNWQNKNKK